MFSQKGWSEERPKISSDLLPSWIRSKRATKRCNRHAEQNRAHIKMCTRPNKFQGIHPSVEMSTAA